MTGRRRGIALTVLLLVAGFPTTSLAGGAPHEMSRISPVPSGSSVSLDWPFVAVTTFISGQMAVSIYERDAPGWRLVQTLGQPGGSTASFGWQVRIKGDVLAVSDIGVNEFRGAVYLYAHEGDAWALRQTLTPASASHSYFGTSLDVDETHLVVGAYNGGTNGEAYIYERTGAGWLLRQAISNPSFHGGFGGDVALDGDQLAVHTCAGNKVEGGYVYVYARSGGTWSQTAMIPGTSGSSCRGARAVGLEGNQLVVGRMRGGSDSMPEAGLVDVYVRSGVDWAKVKTLQAPTVEAWTAFGISVGLSNGRLLVGSAHWPEASDPQSRVYLFEGSGATWSFVRSFNGPRSDWDPGRTSDTFGAEVDLDPSGTFVVGGGVAAYALVKPPAVPPTPPRSLRGSTTSSGPQLFWDPPVDDGGAWIERYDIHRSAPGSTSSSRIASVPASIRTYTDTSATAGTWTYHVTAVNAAGSSAPTSDVTLASRSAPGNAPGVPLDLEASAGPSPGSVKLTWRPPQRGPLDPVADHFNIYRIPQAEGAPNGFPMAVVPADPTAARMEFVDSTATAGAIHFYSVSAATTSAEGPRTESVTVRPGLTLFYLVHGICSGAGMWTETSGSGHPLYERLLDVPNSVVEAAQYAPLPGSTPQDVQRLQAAAIRSLVEQKHPGVERVVIIGHSMGGLIGRGVLEAYDVPSAPITRVITIDSPDRGAELEWWKEFVLDELLCPDAWQAFDDQYLWRDDAPPAWMADLPNDARVTRLLFTQCTDRVESPLVIPGAPAKCSDAYDSAALREDYAEWSGAVLLAWAEESRKADPTWRSNAHANACAGGDRRDGAHPLPSTSVLGFDADPGARQPSFPFHNDGTSFFVEAIADLATRGWFTADGKYDARDCGSLVAPS